MMVLEIFIFRGEQFVGSRVFSETSVTVGRGSTSMLVLDDRQVSRLHATIQVVGRGDESRLVVRDNGSQLGTRLNGQPVSESPFAETDTLEIGVFRLKVTRRSMRRQSEFDVDEPTDAGHLQRPSLPPAPPAPPVAAPPVPSQATPPQAPAPAPTPVFVPLEPLIAPPPVALEIPPTPAPLPAAIATIQIPVVLAPPAGPPPPPAPPPPDVREQDEDDEEEPFVPSFSLLELLDREPTRASGAARHLLEVIHHREGQVLDVQQLPLRGRFALRGRPLLQHHLEGKARLELPPDLGGQVFLQGRPLSVDDVRRGDATRHGVSVLELRDGDRAEISLSGNAPAGAQPDRYHIRFVLQPPPARSQVSLLGRLRPALNGYFALAVMLHGSLLYGLSKLPVVEIPPPAEEARFAEVSLKQIQIEPPPPPEVKPPEPKIAEPKEVPLPTPKLRPVARARVQSRAPRPSAQDNALAALDMIKPADLKGPALKDVVTNINAVSVPSDARSRFKVGGAIGKLPTGEVRLSTAGAAHDATSSGRELLSKSTVGALKGGGSGEVRGVVKQPPAAALQAAGSGRLSRAQIQKVINEHVTQIQGCYERNLMRDRSLAGKITFDWVISTTGAVASVRVRSSTMAGTAVSTCIMQEIRGWVFPTPEGGSVSVTYPFIFSAQGF